MKTPFLIGEQIYLRPLEREDAPLLVQWINDPEITRHLIHRGPMNLSAEEDFVERMNRGENELAVAIALKQDDRLIGSTGLHQIDYRNGQAAFGILLDKAEWGHGHGTAATALMVRHCFETLNLNRVWLEVYEYNQRGLRAYEKVGFRKEGVLRQDNFREGRYWDTIVMAILREEWQSPLQSNPSHL